MVHNTKIDVLVFIFLADSLTTQVWCFLHLNNTWHWGTYSFIVNIWIRQVAVDSRWEILNACLENLEEEISLAENPVLQAAASFPMCDYLLWVGLQSVLTFCLLLKFQNTCWSENLLIGHRHCLNFAFSFSSGYLPFSCFFPMLSTMLSEFLEKSLLWKP